MSSTTAIQSFKASDFCKLRKILKRADYRSSNILSQSISDDFADHSAAVSYLIMGMQGETSCPDMPVG